MATSAKWSARLKQTKANAITIRNAASLNYPGFYIITDATASNNKIIRLEARAANAFSKCAFNLTDDLIGIYNIDTDIFTSLI